MITNYNGIIFSFKILFYKGNYVKIIKQKFNLKFKKIKF